MIKMTFPIILFALTGFLTAQETESAAETTADDGQIAKVTNDLESWTFEKHMDGKGSMKVEEDAIVFSTTETSDETWHVQTHQNGLKFEEGQTYQVTFEMKSPERAFVVLNAMINEEDWHPIGLNEQITCQTEYQEYDFTFTATDVHETNNRVGFQLGEEVATVYVKNLSIKAVE